jgi:hypothetical protein
MTMTNVEAIFTEVGAQTGPNQTQLQQQSGQQSFVNTVTINLKNGLYDDGSILYREIGNIKTNVPELQGIEVLSGAFSDASVSDDILSISFPDKVLNFICQLCRNKTRWNENLLCRSWTVSELYK